MRGTWQTTDGGGGGLVLVLIAAAVLLGSGAVSAAVSALVTILIILGCVTGLAVLGGVAWLVYRARSERPGRLAAAPVVYEAPRPQTTPLVASQARPAAIESPRREYHLHIHGVSADELAAVLRRIDHEEEH